MTLMIVSHCLRTDEAQNKAGDERVLACCSHWNLLFLENTANANIGFHLSRCDHVAALKVMAALFAALGFVLLRDISARHKDATWGMPPAFRLTVVSTKAKHPSVAALEIVLVNVDGRRELNEVNARRLKRGCPYDAQ
ncbi:hypothetical protein [Rhizobium sp. LEGMi135b]